MFFGFPNEEEAKSFFGIHFPEIDQRADSKQITVCSRDKKCVGSMNGDFIYDDGSTDKGVVVISKRYDTGKHIYAWIRELN